MKTHLINDQKRVSIRHFDCLTIIDKTIQYRFAQLLKWIYNIFEIDERQTKSPLSVQSATLKSK